MAVERPLWSWRPRLAGCRPVDCSRTWPRATDASAPRGRRSALHPSLASKNTSVRTRRVRGARPTLPAEARNRTAKIAHDDTRMPTTVKKNLSPSKTTTVTSAQRGRSQQHCPAHTTSTAAASAARSAPLYPPPSVSGETPSAARRAAGASWLENLLC